MALVRRLRWSFVHMELIVNECCQGHNLQRNNYYHHRHHQVNLLRMYR